MDWVRYVCVCLLVVWAPASVAQDMPVQTSEEAQQAEEVATEADQSGGVLIFGATRNTGLELAKLLTARGDKVTAFVRPSSDLSGLEPLTVDYVKGDAMDLDTVQAAFDGVQYDAIVTTLSCYGCDNPPDYEGNKNVIDAAKAAGVKRLILITSVGAGDSADTPPFIVRWFLRKILPLKTQAEDHLLASGLDYTIIRPGGLKSEEPTGGAYLSEDRETMGIITRADLAQLIVDCLDDPATAGKIYAAVDKNMSWPWDMF